MSRYQKGKANLDFTEARDSEWQWHQLGHMQVCTSLQTDNHASTPPLIFFTDRMPFLPPNQQRQSAEGNYISSIPHIRNVTDFKHKMYSTIFFVQLILAAVLSDCKCSPDPLAGLLLRYLSPFTFLTQHLRSRLSRVFSRF